MKEFYGSTLKAVFALFLTITSVTIASAQAPSCATGLQPINGGNLTSNKTPFTWTAPSGGATGYRIYIGTNGGGVTQPNNLVNGTALGSTSYTYAGTLNCGTTYYWQVVPYNNPGNISATGCAIQSFTITAPGDPAVFPVGSWNAYCYNSTNWTNYTGYYTATGQDFDSRVSWNTNNSPSSADPNGATNYFGCSIPVDNHSVIYKREGFTPGTYSLNILNDDGCSLYLNGTLIYSRAAWTGTYINNVWTGNLDGSSQIEFRWTEGGGGSNGSIVFVPIATPTLVAGTIAGTQSLCFGNTDPIAFTSTLAASGACSPVTYQWQSDVNCTGIFTDIPGANAATYDAPAGVTQTTCYRRMVLDANCGRSLASNTITVTVYATPPGDPSVIPSNSWNGYVYGFASYSSADAGWTDYRGSFSYTGPSDPSFNTSSIYTTANLPMSAPGYTGCSVTANLSGVQMKRQGFPTGTYSLDFSSDDAGYLYINGTLIYSRTTAGTAINVWTGNLDASSTVELRYKNNTANAQGALTFNLIPTPTLNPGVIAGDQILCSGNNPYPFTSTTPASGSCSAITYQWQQDVGCTGTFADIVGAVAATYDVPAGITQTTCYRRAIIDVNCGRTDYTNTVTITVTAVQQGDPTVFPMDSWNGYVFDFATTGYTTANNNWTDYKGFYPINSLSFNTTTIYANNGNNPPSIAAGYAGCQLATATLTGTQIKRQGFPTGTYQIDFTTDDAGFLFINGILVYSRTTNGAVTNVWTGNLDASSTVDFRYKNNGGPGGGALTFTTVAPTISLTEGGIALNGPSTICPSNAVTPIVSTSDAASSCYLYYQWQVDSTGTGYLDVIGATSVAYTPASLSTSASYRRKVTDACGDVAYSNSVDINVGPSTVPDASVFGSNAWIAYVYNQQNYVPASLFGSYTDPGVSATDPSFNSMNSWSNISAPSLAATYTGCQVGVDGHSVSYKREGFPAGTYTLNVLNDDAAQLFVDGVVVYSRGSYTPTFINGVWTGVLGPTSKVEFRWTEGVGASHGAVTFLLVTTPGPLLGGTISNAKTQVCSGDTPTAFTSTALPSDGCAVVAYQWQLDTGSGYTDIAGATATTYNPVAQTVSTSYRRRVTDACAQIAYSNVFTINVVTPTPPNPAIFGSNVWNVYAYNDVAFTQLRGSYVDNGFSPSDASFDSRNKWVIGASPSNAPGYTGCQTNVDQHGVIYKRQGFPTGIYRLDYNSDDAGSVYINGVLVYTSVSWGTLVTNIWTGPLNASTTIEYRWADTGGGQSYGQLSIVSTSVTPLVPGTIANASSIVCSGDAPAPFTSTANASGGCYKTYQWQISTISTGAGFADIAGATAATYTPVPITATSYYRRKVTDACGNTFNSNAVTIIVGVPSPPTLSWGNGQWNAFVYNGRNFTTLNGSYIESNVSSSNYSFDSRSSWAVTSRPSLAPTYSGCQVTDNAFSVSFRQTNFVTGTYQIDLEADDDAVLIINGVTQFTGTAICCAPRVNVWTGTLNASSQVEIRYGENNGNAYCKATITSTTPPALLPGTIGADQTICTGEVPATFTSVANATSGCAITYQWRRSTTSATGPWTNIGGNSSTLALAPPGQTQTSYYVRNVTDACGRSASSNVITVTLNPKPNNAGAMTGLASVCSGQTGVAYSIAPVTYATSYTWVVPAGATITSGDGTNAVTITFGSTSGDVVVQPVNTCGVGLTSKVTVNVTPSIPAATSAISGPASVCQAQFNVLYSVPAVPNAVSYIWTLPAGATFNSGATTNAPRITFGSTSGSITVTPTNACGNALTATTLAVTVTPTPGAAGAITGTGTVCPGQTGVAFSIAAVANATTYNWSLPAGASITSGLGTRSIIVTFGSTSGNVTVTPTNSCGTGTSRSLLVSVVALGTTGAIAGTSPVCENSTGRIYTVPVTTGASTYTWTVPPGATIVSGNGTRTINVTMGTTSGDITVTPSNSCSTGATSTRAIAVTNAVPTTGTAIVGDINPCRAQTGVTYSTTSTGATSYAWTVPSGSIITAGANTNTITVTIGPNSGNVTVTPSNVCGNAAPSTTQAIVVKPFPAAVGAITGPVAVCKGETGIVYSIAPVADALTYTWTVPTGATVTSGAGTTSITVSYAAVSVTSGNVSVVAGNTCSTTSNSKTISIDNACPYTWTGTTSTVWNVATNWNLGFVPTNTNDVVIPSTVISGNMPVISASSTARSLSNAGTIIISGTGTLNVYGNINNTGTITTASGSTINMVGSTAQTITGVPSVQNLVINNSAGVSVASTLTINRTLSLTSGALTTNNNVTINFDNGGNIGYNVSDAGSISGNVSGTRNLVAKTHYISTPFAGVTSGQINASTPIYNVSPAAWLLSTKNYTSQGWDLIKDYTTVMTPGTGYSLGMFNASALSMTGTYNHGATYSSGSYDNTIPASMTRGMYFMMGNPYPSTLDWDNAGGWTKTNINDAIYFWNPTNSSVSSYVGGVGTNGATQYIPAMQSFLVKVPGGGGFSSLTVNNNARVLTNTSYFRTGSPELVRLEVKNATATSVDETVVRMDDIATADFDSDADASKIKGSLALYTKATGGSEEYSINTLPMSGPEMLVPLNLKVAVNGLYTIECKEYSIAGYSMILEDKLTQSYTLMENSTIYTINANKTDSTNRFVLRFVAGLTTGVRTGNSTDLQISTYDNQMMLNASGIQTSNATINVYDASGLNVETKTGESIAPGIQTKSMAGLPSGVYIVKIKIEGTTYVGKVVLK